MSTNRKGKNRGPGGSLSDSGSLTSFPTPVQLESFQDALKNWFEVEGRDYPWRQTSDPYAILVSELMLQQTRIETVLGRGYYQRWLDRFPTTAALAEAEEAEILKLWEGLGYYNRARNLQKTAREIEETYDGQFPTTVEEILALPGVGRYTAGAVASFAFGLSAPIVDGNVTRVLARLFRFESPIETTSSKKQFWTWAEEMTPSSGAREYNSAIMELGQRICTRSSPHCPVCPVQSHCRAQSDGVATELPRKGKRTEILERTEYCLFAYQTGSVYLVPESGSRRKGLWRLPEISEETSGDLVERLRFDYAITRYRVNLRVFEANPSLIADLESAEKGAWVPLHTPDAWPALGSPYRKALENFQKDENESGLSF